jgi:Ni,Fe-hydrogenase maturation factor
MDARVPEEPNMKDPVCKLTEHTGALTSSVKDAVDKAIKRALDVRRAWTRHGHLK